MSWPGIADICVIDAGRRPGQSWIVIVRGWLAYRAREVANRMARPQIPDFAALFTVCRCGKASCGTCDGFQLTPRTAAVLWSVAQILADRGYDDVEEHGSDLLPGRAGWYLFDRYPRLTWRQDAGWRRRAARAYDDLAADLAAGGWPLPTCPAEEMALHLILEDAPCAVEDGWTGLDEADFDALPTHPDDLDWDAMPDVLFQDTDILHLFEPGLDGIDDPADAVNAEMAIGDYRPPAWFEHFANMQPRDERRGFRR